MLPALHPLIVMFLALVLGVANVYALREVVRAALAAVSKWRRSRARTPQCTSSGVAATMRASSSHRAGSRVELFEYRLSNDTFADAVQELNPRAFEGSPIENLMLGVTRNLLGRR